MNWWSRFSQLNETSGIVHVVYGFHKREPQNTNWPLQESLRQVGLLQAEQIGHNNVNAYLKMIAGGLRPLDNSTAQEPLYYWEKIYPNLACQRSWQFWEAYVNGHAFQSTVEIVI